MLNFLLACVHLDPIGIVRTGGYVGIFLLVFAESGLLFGILLPGDSLLFAAGLLSAGGLLQVGPLAVIVVIAAILGDSVGYWFGKSVGSNFFKKEDSVLFKKEYVTRTERFYKKYGGRAVILARFVPIIRTITPILAGVGSMKYKLFVPYNALGGLVWGAGMVLLGFFLGAILPGSEHYVFPLSLLIIVLSFFPIGINLYRGNKIV